MMPLPGRALRAWLPLAGLTLASACASSPPPPLSVVLVTIDTLRADHLPIYGYERSTAPRLSAFAASGVVFDNARTPIPETAPACATLLTGRLPAHHGLRGNGRPLGPEPATLATLLAAAGYSTAAFVSGVPLTARLSGLDRGFAHYDDDLPDARGHVPGVQRAAPKTTSAALAWLERQGPGPFFLWVHYYDPHGDYAPGPPWESAFPAGGGPLVPLESIPEYQRLGGEHDASVYVSRYDGEILRVDTELGRLFDRLGRDDLRQRTLVVITADHGESLTEHGELFDHGNELYEPTLRIPLVMAGPGLPGGRRVAGLVQSHDLLPTLLDLVRAPAPPGMTGISLAPAMRDGSPLPAREILSEARFQPYRALVPGADIGPKLALRDARFTIIARLASGRMEAYDRQTDPGETLELLQRAEVAERRDLEAALAAGLRARLEAAVAGRPGAPVLAPALRARLERLSGAPS